MNLKKVRTVEADKFADFVVLDADPLANIQNTKRIQALVIRRRRGLAATPGGKCLDWP